MVTVETRPTLDLKQPLGRTGLERSGDDILDEFLPALRGRNGLRVYREMRDNDETIGAAMFAIEGVIRKTPWTFRRAKTKNPKADEALAFVNECVADMDHTFDEFLVEASSFLTFGWSLLEIIYKERRGENADKKMRSRYDDGRLGWRSFSLRAQESLDGWQYENDDDEMPVAMYQRAAPDYNRRTIPLARSILFRERIAKQNPEGRSVLRNAYRSWYFKKRFQEIEAHGIARDLVGLPVLEMPIEFFEATPQTNPEKARLRAQAFELAQRARRNEQEAIALPHERTLDDKPSGWRLRLLSTGGSRQINIDAIVQRYDRRISMTVLSNFLFLGMDSGGTEALANSLIDLFMIGAGAINETIAQTFNRVAVAQLMTLNGFEREVWPELAAGEVRKADVTPFVKAMTEAISGGLITPDDNLEAFARAEMRLPEARDDDNENENDVQVNDARSTTETLESLARTVQVLVNAGDMESAEAIRLLIAQRLGVPPPSVPLGALSSEP